MLENQNSIMPSKSPSNLDTLVQATYNHNYTIKDITEVAQKILDKLTPIGTVKSTDPGLPIPDGLLARLDDANIHIDNNLKVLYSIIDKISQQI